MASGASGAARRAKRVTTRRAAARTEIIRVRGFASTQASDESSAQKGSDMPDPAFRDSRLHRPRVKLPAYGAWISNTEPRGRLRRTQFSSSSIAITASRSRSHLFGSCKGQSSSRACQRPGRPLKQIPSSVGLPCSWAQSLNSRPNTSSCSASMGTVLLNLPPALSTRPCSTPWASRSTALRPSGVGTAGTSSGRRRPRGNDPPAFIYDLANSPAGFVAGEPMSRLDQGRLSSSAGANVE